MSKQETTKPKYPRIYVARDRMWKAFEGGASDRLRMKDKQEIVWDCMQRLEKSSVDPSDAHRLVFWLYWDEQRYMHRLAWRVDQTIPREEPRA